MRRLALSSETFRVLAHDLSDLTSDYLEKLAELPSYPPGISGQQTEHLFGGDIPLDGIGAAAFDSLPGVFENSRPASPRFFGYVFGSGEPVAALGDFAASVLHQNAAAWRSAPAAITIERTVHAVACDGSRMPRIQWKPHPWRFFRESHGFVHGPRSESSREQNWRSRRCRPCSHRLEHRFCSRELSLHGPCTNP